MKGEHMNDGVRILLERMETHPEEFDAMGRDSKWENLVYKFSEWLDEEDKEAFKNAIKKMRQQKFTELVMEELVDPAEKSRKTKGNAFTQNLRKAALAAQIPAIPSITLEQTEHLRAHLDALALGQTPIAGVTQTL
jgi:hypothetical protein